MNKSELIEAVASRLDGNRKAAATAVDGVIDEITRALVKGDRVSLTGFGTFEKRARAARTARNPATGEPVKVKKTTVPAFKAGATSASRPSRARSAASRSVTAMPSETSTRSSAIWAPSRTARAIRACRRLRSRRARC